MLTQQEKTAVRKSLPLTQRDLRDLSLLAGSPARRTALFALVDVDVSDTEDVSESQLLHALLKVGLRAVAERAEEDSYAAEAAARNADDDAARRASARRRRPDWADEA